MEGRKQEQKGVEKVGKERVLTSAFLFNCFGRLDVMLSPLTLTLLSSESHRQEMKDEKAEAKGGGGRREEGKRKN